MYHLGSGRFFRIDEPAYRLLELCRTMPLESAKASLAASGTYSDIELEDTALEVEWLGTKGFFDAPDFTITEDEVERQLEQRYAGAWTKLELALAETCNLACTYCYCRTCRDMPNQGLMSEAVARQAITWLFAMSGQSKEVGITFFGGEPLLNKPVLRFAIEYSQRLAKLHGKKVRYTMTTNGTLLDDEVIDYIKKYNFGLMVSLDGPPEIHNAQCPTQDGRGSFDMAAAGIKKLMRRRKRVTVRCTMTKNSPPMLDLIKFFEDFGFTRIVLGPAINPVRPTAHNWECSDLNLLDRQQDGLLSWMFEELSRCEIPRYFPYAAFLREYSRPERGTGSRDMFHCGACRGTTTVGADGVLYPCHRYVGMRASVMGSIFTGPDYDRAKRFWQDYWRATQKECGKCWAKSLCQAPCPWSIATHEGLFRSPSREDCALRHAFFERAAYLQYRLQVGSPTVYESIISGKNREETEDT